MIDLRGKTALVTGASAGIGWEIARVLAREVGTLILVARRRERLAELAEQLRSAHGGLRVEVRPADLIDRAATDALLDALEQEGEQVDVLINNAGSGDFEYFDRSDRGKIERMVDLNVVSATILLHRIVPKMVSRGFGAILNVGSIAGIVGRPQFAVYSATKAYLNHLSDLLHSELAGTGVTVTVVCPGPVATEFQAIAGSDRYPLPEAIHIDAADCAEQAVDAMKRGRARLVPGAIPRMMAFTANALPKAVVRSAFAYQVKRERTRG
jgi:uncharacterized protein